MKTKILAALIALTSVCTMADDRPSVLIIQADDVSKDMFSPWNPKARTPTIERLAREGVAFRTYLSPSICAPARFALITSRSARVSNCYHNDLDSRRYQQDVNQFLTIAEMFKAEGYATGFAGKWNVPGDIRHYDEARIWEHSSAGLPFPIGMEAPGKTSRYWHPAIVTETGEQVRTGPNDFGPILFNEFAVDFIRRNRGGQFFMHCALVEPHAMGKGQYPSLGSPSLVGSNDARFRRLCEFIDRMVANLLAEIDPDNTVVIFCADNPTAVEGKQWASPDGITGSPCIIWGKGVARRGMTRQLFSAHDVMPTLGAMLEAPSFTTEGRNHRDFVQGDYALTSSRKMSYVGASQILTTRNSYFVRDAVRGNAKGTLVKNRREVKRLRTKRAYGRYCQGFSGQLLRKGSGIMRGNSKFVSHWRSAERKEDAWYRQLHSKGD